MIEAMIHTAQEGNRLLREHGLSDWRFEISKTKTTIGRCRYNDKVIEVSMYFLESPWSEIRDTILHEIAHALAGPKANHGPLWRAQAIRVGANPARCYEGNAVVNAAKHNYVMRCPSCDKHWYRYRMRRRNFNARCPDCRTPIKIYKVVRNGQS